MGTQIIGMHEAKSTLSQLVQRAAAGETIYIGPRGQAQVKMVAVNAPTKEPRVLGRMKGRIKVHGDFDAPLPDDVLDLFGSGR
ncbi:MAG: type II toxin-antitoxin system Phd/YefM family antitoxin [Burkholderiales bacterium]|jgi:antitoxin (DNA-binding transcriptional repressor) of toxin-antitoxin stability system